MVGTSRTFRLTYDYLCPFARIASESVIDAIRRGADWDVVFHPFSLSEAHVADGEPSVWRREAGSAGTRGTRAHAWALAVTQLDPNRFHDFHLGVFGARHDEAVDIDDDRVLGKVAVASGIDAAAVADLVASGEPLQQLADRHREAVERWSVFGVPTFIVGDEAVFIRLMERHRASDLERVLDLVEWMNLNEFKRTTIPR